MKKITLVGIALSLMVPSLSFAQNAALYFSSSVSTYTVGQTINVAVIADPRGVLADTVRAVIRFPKENFQVQSVKLNPVFSVADPDSFHSNVDGIISYGAGIPGGIDK